MTVKMNQNRMVNFPSAGRFAGATRPQPGRQRRRRRRSTIRTTITTAVVPAAVDRAAAEGVVAAEAAVGEAAAVGRFDPAQMRQRMMQRLQQDLGASDDEFAVLEPKIDAVMQLRRDAGGGFNPRMFMRRGGGGGGGDAGGASTQPQSPAQQAVSDLQSTLDDASATPDQIKSKLDTLRQARAQAKADLSKSEDDLRSLLTQRQEAQLVLYGILD